MVEKPGATGAVTLCLSLLSLVVMGITPAAQSHHTLATSTAGQGICSALGALVDELTRSPVLVAAGGRVEGLQLAGFANLVACGQAVGASIKELQTEQQVERARQTPPNVQVQLPQQQPPPLSPELQRIAELEALLSRAQAAAAQVQLGSTAPPPTGLPVIPPIGNLVGFDIVRVPGFFGSTLDVVGALDGDTGVAHHS